MRPVTTLVVIIIVLTIGSSLTPGQPTAGPDFYVIEGTHTPLWTHENDENYSGAVVQTPALPAHGFVVHPVYASEGLNTYAMQSLGEAMHTLQDAESPAHKGFQEAWPDDLLSLIWNYPKHIYKETVTPGQENLAAAENATRRVWEYFSGAPMPSNFFPD